MLKMYGCVENVSYLYDMFTNNLTFLGFVEMKKIDVFKFPFIWLC